jgi:hypothetical protein
MGTSNLVPILPRSQIHAMPSGKPRDNHLLHHDGHPLLEIERQTGGDWQSARRNVLNLRRPTAELPVNLAKLVATSLLISWCLLVLTANLISTLSRSSGNIAGLYIVTLAKQGRMRC